MPILKLSLTKEDDEKLAKLAKEENLSAQDYIRYKVFSVKSPSKFTPEEAERRALEKFSGEDEPFTLPDIYGEEWVELNPRMTGVFGKRFFYYLESVDSPIKFNGMTADRRRSTYKIVK